MISTGTDKHTITSAGLIASLVDVAKNGIGLFLSRLELAALELSEARNSLLKLLLLSALALVAICFAIAYGTVLIVYLSWASLGWKILGVMALGFAAVALALLLCVRHMLIQGRLSLPATMVELQSDRDIVTGLS